MAAKAYDGRSVIADIVEGCSGLILKSTVIKALRAVCRYFGGQLIYIPVTKNMGGTIDEFRGVIVDAVGDEVGEKILNKITTLFGGAQIYIPMEKGAFRKIIALEIFEHYDGSKKKVRDLCREYGMSFTQVYRLWIEGRGSNKKNK